MPDESADLGNVRSASCGRIPAPGEDEYDDTPWTKEELHALAWQAGKRVGWEDMDEYDDPPEKP
jgi:hypothetical protein